MRFAGDCFDFFDHLGLHDAVLLGHSAGCTVIWSFIDLFGQDCIRALVFCDEMIAGIRRPECGPRQSAGGTGHRAAETRLWPWLPPSPDGKASRCYVISWPACSLRSSRKPTLPGSLRAV